jgi:hypothetical protein
LEDGGATAPAWRSPSGGEDRAAAPAWWSPVVEGPRAAAVDVAGRRGGLTVTAASESGDWGELAAAAARRDPSADHGGSHRAPS